MLGGLNSRLSPEHSRTVHPEIPGPVFWCASVRARVFRRVGAEWSLVIRRLERPTHLPLFLTCVQLIEFAL